jgi:DNA polymerase-3 subunit alpha
VIDDLRDLFERYPGDSEFVLEMHTRAGVRRLRFGNGYRVAARDAGLKSELDRLLGPAVAPAVAAA